MVSERKEELTSNDNILILRTLMERAKQEDKKLFMIFLDLEKAFDRVIRKKLWNIIKKILKNKKLVRVMQALYKENTMVFNLGEFVTEEVELNNGLRQGCQLSPIFFELYEEETIIRLLISALGVKIGNSNLPCLAYADDIVLLAEEEIEMLKILETVAEQLNLKFSISAKL